MSTIIPNKQKKKQITFKFSQYGLSRCTCIITFNKINSSFQLAMPFFLLRYAVATHFQCCSQRLNECFAKTIVYLRSTDKEGKTWISKGTACRDAELSHDGSLIGAGIAITRDSQQGELCHIYCFLVKKVECARQSVSHLSFQNRMSP